MGKRTSKQKRMAGEPMVIPPSRVAKVLGEALRVIADAGDGSKAATKRLGLLLSLGEVRALERLVTEPRVICARCKAGRSLRDCSGPYCLDCAIIRRREAEAEAVLQ